MQRLFAAIDSVSEYTGRFSSWFCVALVVVLSYETIARYLFNAPTVWAHVSAMMLYGTIGMLGLAYTHLHQGHIRVDVIYARLSRRQQALLDCALYLLFVFPLLYILIRLSGVFAWDALVEGRVMMQSYWYPPAWPFRTIVFVGWVLFTAQCICEFLRTAAVVVRGATK